MVSKIYEGLYSARRGRSLDVDLETSVEVPRISYYLDLCSVDRTRILPLKVEERLDCGTTETRETGLLPPRSLSPNLTT